MAVSWLSVADEKGWSSEKLADTIENFHGPYAIPALIAANEHWGFYGETDIQPYELLFRMPTESRTALRERINQLTAEIDAPEALVHETHWRRYKRLHDAATLFFIARDWSAFKYLVEDLPHMTDGGFGTQFKPYAFSMDQLLNEPLSQAGAPRLLIFRIRGFYRPKSNHWDDWELNPEFLEWWNAHGAELAGQ